MHALRIPTTRALAVAATGEQVLRENILPGAVLTRVAASHIRVGTFQFFAARGDVEAVRKLAEYTIARHDPDVAATAQPFFGLLRNVAKRQAALIAQWMNVGFIHGVMNTDNMAISGETIDYGPCAFMEAYDPATVFSSIDEQGRYAFGNQPDIACWNLARFAETLLPLLSNDRDEAIALATDVVAELFPSSYRSHLLDGQRAKLGLQRRDGNDDAADRALVDDWLALLHAERVDFTLGWRRLADAAAGDESPLRSLFTNPEAPSAWLSRWRVRCERDDATQDVKAASLQRAERMLGINPIIIPRNHRVEEALTTASRDRDMGPFVQLLAAIQQPFVEMPEHARYAEPAPASVTACYRTFCGT